MRCIMDRRDCALLCNVSIISPLNSRKVCSSSVLSDHLYFFFQAEDGIRDRNVTGVQTCALPISSPAHRITSAAVWRGQSGRRFTLSQSASQHRLGRPHWPSPVNPFQQHRELRRRQHRHALFGAWPYEAAAFQPLGEQTQPVTIPPQQFNQIAAASAETEYVTRDVSLPSTVSACTAKLSKPFRISVAPAASQIRVPAGKPIIAAAR